MPKKISFFLKNPQVLNKKYLFILTVLLSTGIFLLLQPGQISLAQEAGFIKTIGGPNFDWLARSEPTSDGGYIVWGVTNSYGAGEADLFIVKIDGSYNISWVRTIGGPASEAGHPGSVSQTSDGGYIIGASTRSWGAGEGDILVTKLDSSGNLSWARTIGGPGWDGGRNITVRQTSDGGYIVLGATNSYGVGNEDLFVIKLNNLGNLSWTKTYGGTYGAPESAPDIQQTSDGGYMIMGNSYEFGVGTCTDGSCGDITILKIDGSGNLLWARAIGSPLYDFTDSNFLLTPDGGYVFTAGSSSYGDSILIVKLDSSNNISWARAISGPNADGVSFINHTSDGGYIIAGYTDSYGAGSWDGFLVKLNSSGNLDWARTIGGPSHDYLQYVNQNPDGSYFITGYTASYGAGWDGWIMRLDSSGNIDGCPLIASATPEVISVALTVMNAPYLVTSPVPAVANVAPTITSHSPTIDTQCLFSMSTDPTVTTQVATGVATSSATLNMDYTVGDYSPVEVRFIWKKTVDPSWENTAWVSRAANGSYSEDLIGLVASTEYHFKAQLRYNETEINGATSTFTTLSVAPPPPPPPGTCDYHNVWGWAWANMESPSHDPTIGWISFSCRNCDSDGDGTTDTGNYAQCPVGDPSNNYGVHINPLTGQFSGHAWSGGGVDAAGNEVPVLGWLSFNITETGPPPGDPVFGTHLAQVSTTTGDVSGWARFLAACDSVPCTSSGPCANCGGWDGWIKLRDASWPAADAVWIDSSNYAVLGYSEFRKWAWGDDVVGWVSFNCANEGCGPSDYKVMTDLSFAPPPSLPYIESATSTDEYCNIFAGVGRVDFIWTYKHDDGYNQASYHLQVATDSTFGTILVDYQPSDPQIVSPNGKGSSAILIVEDPGTNPNCGVGDSFEDRCVAYGPPYSWRVKVKDENDNWSADWGPDPPASFATPAHAWPWPDFDWAPTRPSIGEPVQLCATVATSTCDIVKLSICYDAASNPISCAGKIFNWTIPGNASFIDGTDSSSENPRIQFNSFATENKVKVIVTDPGVGFCEKEKDMGRINLPLPDYREVRPRSQLGSLLARLISSFLRF